MKEQEDRADAAQRAAAQADGTNSTGRAGALARLARTSNTTKVATAVAAGATCLFIVLCLAEVPRLLVALSGWFDATLADFSAPEPVNTARTWILGVFAVLAAMNLRDARRSDRSRTGCSLVRAGSGWRLVFWALALAYTVAGALIGMASVQERDLPLLVKALGGSWVHWLGPAMPLLCAVDSPRTDQARARVCANVLAAFGGPTLLVLGGFDAANLGLLVRLWVMLLLLERFQVQPESQEEPGASDNPRPAASEPGLNRQTT